MPCGKLPQSFPAKNEDTPVSDTPEHVKERYIGISVPGKPSRVETSEGVFTGYRWYDKTGIRPLFPFGFGLSYTEYTYSNMKLSPGTDEKTAFSVELDITNSGNYEGDEIVQVYLGGGRGPAGLDTPEKKLCAFTRVSGLKPGETRHETLPVPVKSLMVYAPENGVLWQRMEGPFRVMAGASSEDIRLEETWDGTDR